MTTGDPAIERNVRAVHALLLRSDSGLQLIDCREPDEFQICRIEGARLVPLSKFPELIFEFLPDTDVLAGIYCHHGIRSIRAANFLRQRGYSQVFSMEGGIEAWSREIDPRVPRY